MAKANTLHIRYNNNDNDNNDKGYMCKTINPKQEATTTTNMSEPAEKNVFPIVDVHSVPDKFFSYAEEIKSIKVPIIIDNGSYQCKAGWAINENPSLIFRNLVAKNRSKKDHIQVGNEISNIELIRWLVKTQFDRNVVTQFDIQELIYDHIFSHLGIDTSGCVDHPIILTEAVCNPSHSRQLMSELLFECYQIPKLIYGVDAMYSFIYNKSASQAKSGIIVCSGYNTTHIIPVLHGQMDLPQCRRINIGGSHMASFLHRLLQLKYPAHFSSTNLSRCELLIYKHMGIATYFQEELEKWNDDDYYEEHVHKIQLPYKPLPGSIKSASGGKMERCYAMLKRLQESGAEKRAETIVADEERLQHLLTLQELLEDDEDDALLQRSLHELGINSGEELQQAINRVNQRIQKTRNYLPYFCLDGNDLQEVQQKRVCSELQLYKFSDPESWIKVVKQKCEELRRAKHKLEQCPPGRQKATSSKHLPKKFELIAGLKPSETENMEELEAIKDEEKLRELESIVREYDREFNKKQSTGLEPSYSFNLADYYQLHLGIERIRIPEILFQPSIIGVDQAGISETLETLLACYPPEVQLNLVENVFLTGGCTLIPGFKERMQAELLSMRPFQTPFHIQMAGDPTLNPWHGAKQWIYENDNLQKYGITKAEYEEKGGDYFKQYSASNWYLSNVT